MSTVVPARMQGPAGVSSAEIMGHSYELDNKGRVKVAIQDHVAVLRRHGFTDCVDDEAVDHDIDEMDRDALVEFIEERGGDVPDKIKMKALRELAKQHANG